MTSIKKRLDNVLNELDCIGIELDEEKAKNIMAQLRIVKGAYRQTQNAPMCCFHYDADQKLCCDMIGPLEKEAFMQECKACQAHIRDVLANLEVS